MVEDHARWHRAVARLSAPDRSRSPIVAQVRCTREGPS